MDSNIARVIKSHAHKVCKFYIKTTIFFKTSITMLKFNILDLKTKGLTPSSIRFLLEASRILTTLNNTHQSV